MGTIPEIHVGDQVQLRKKHPCGSVQWLVYRIGADIGIRCLGCQRRVMLSRADFNKRLKRVVVPVSGTENTTSSQ